MTAQHSKSVALSLLAALALLVGFAGGAAQPASADASQWQMQQPHWWDNSNGWRNHHQWPSQWRQHNQFNDGIHRCFGSCFGSRIVIRGNRVFFISPGLIGNPGFIVRQPTTFIVRQPTFIVQQPAFIVRQPAFIVRQPAFIVRQPAFIIGGQGLVIRQSAKQRAFFTRHPSLHMGGGVHIIHPGMMN